MAESLGAERVMELLNRYLTAMSEAVLDQAGTVVSFMGDGLMAVFGSPLERDDHASAALAAAREMLEVRLPAFNDWLGERGLDSLRMGVGLNSGAVMSGTVGSERRLEYAAVGDTTNVAARIESMTRDRGGGLLLSAATYELLTPQEAHALEPAGVAELRGRSGAVELWTLRGERPALRLLAGARRAHAGRKIGPSARSRPSRLLAACPPTGQNRPNISAVQVTVRLFAMLRERAGASEVVLDLPEGARVRDALAELSSLAAGLPLVMAVNREYAREDQALAAGDELALIPPVAGGGSASSPWVRVTAEPLSPMRCWPACATRAPARWSPSPGVTREVERLEYEAYAEMAEERLAEIAAEAVERHGLCAAAVEHRVGSVGLSEPSVVVAVSAPHRGEAFAGAREIIDRAKSEAPIWKKEVEGGEERWVEGEPPASGH